MRRAVPRPRRGPALRRAATCLALTAAGCATAPLSFLDGHKLDRVTLNRYGVRIVAVDGQMMFHNPVQVAPGTHSVVIEALRAQGPNLQIQQAFAFHVEPCTHYYLVADRESPLLSQWTLAVERTEKVGACDPQEELRKAKATSAP
jgi:hypothetical protein